MKSMLRTILTIIALLATLTVAAQQQDSVVVNPDDLVLEEVSVSARRASTVKSRTSAFNTQRINSEELCKAACCNLSESFETNASVDVAYSDAVTGAKQIRLLGLSGTYVQLLTENIPGIRGLAQTFGLEYIPGPWMESIQVSKGTASVINGYEATTGQINIEYLKPHDQDPLAVNLMLNTELHTEVNITGGWHVTPHNSEKGEITTGVLAHYQFSPMEMDGNKDRYMDMPVGRQLNLLNRWDISKGNYTGRILVRGIYDRKYAGEATGSWLWNTPKEPVFRFDMRTSRIEGFMKNGYVIDHDRNMSIGIITAFSYHDQDNNYLINHWCAAQTNAYLNALFQTDLAEGHKLTTGLSVNYDRYREILQTEDKSISDLSRQEVTPGVFAEYSYIYEDKLSLLAGVRGDWSSRYGFFCTPRANIRYTPWEWWVIRASAGMGYRSPNMIADNASVLASRRTLHLPAEGLKQERAVNAGISTTFYIPIKGKELQLSGEYYYTHFIEGCVVDIDSDPFGVSFLNSNGSRNYAQSWQVEASMEILRGWTMTVAFRQSDVKQTVNGVLRAKPLTPKFKGIITTSYVTPLRKWQFDVTAQFNGGGRMPDPDESNPLWEKEYKWYPQLMAQITKYWRTCSLYVGAENMTNYTQQNPVIEPLLGTDTQPYAKHFDASMVYAPVSGWKVYVGFRWKLGKKEED